MTKSVKSKSTDKLEVMNEIVSTTLSKLTQEKRDKLTSLQIDWKEVNVGGIGCQSDHMVVPNLSMTFAE